MNITYILYSLSQLYLYIVLAYVIMSWLVSFNVISVRYGAWNQIWRILNQLTDPVFRPLRRIIPNFGGIDITPIVVFFGIRLFQRLIFGLF